MTAPHPSQTEHAPQLVSPQLVQHQWEAMGTLWHISLFAEGQPVAQPFWRSLEDRTREFEERLSRFLPHSEVNRWSRAKQGGTDTVSDTLADLLHLASGFKHLTRGAFDPAVGGLLEAAGYNPQYSFQDHGAQQWRPPEWSIVGNQLTYSGPLVIDIGGYGKGYWIDALSTLVAEAGWPHHLVDGGGDMYATTKPDGSGWRVAIEVPGKPDEALEVVLLKNQALAVSDTLKRQWGSWSHVVDPLQSRPARNLDSAAVLASTAVVADALTTCLMVADRSCWSELLAQYPAEYLLTSQGKAEWSPGWPISLLRQHIV